MDIIDSHCHLEKFHKRGELNSVLDRSDEANVSKMIAVGTRPEDWTLYRQLADDYQGKIYYTMGLHPCYVDEGWEQDLQDLEDGFPHSIPPVALGEIGLDYFHLPKDPVEAESVKQVQQRAFCAQLSIAAARQCPVIIHSRHAFQDCMNLIDESGVDWDRVVFHCFGDGPEEVALLNQRGGRASFTGIVTYKNATVTREALMAQDLSYLMIETDAPYLAPVPKRGKGNEPAYLHFILEHTAQLLGMSASELATITRENTCRFFGLQSEG